MSPTERLADRTHLGPDHRHPDDVPLPGTEDLTPVEVVYQDDPNWPCGDDACTCVDLVDLDRLPPTVVPADDHLGGLPVVTPALRLGVL